MLRILMILAALGVGNAAQALTPEELRAMVDERAANADPFQALLNDPDPVRSLAALELMVESGEPNLMRMAVNFGLQSALPEIRRAAVIGFLKTRPTLQVRLDASGNQDKDFEYRFRAATYGTLLADGTAVFTINVGAFDPEKNCFLYTGRDYCTVEISPDGLTTTKRGESNDYIRSNLSFSEDGTLTGASTIYDVKGGFPTTLRITE